MASKITFLHTADFHIGAPMRGFCDLSEAWAARLGRAILEAYDRVIETALKRSVDFVVMAGDMFDTSQASYGEYLHFFEGLDALDAAGIPVYMVAGNHDPYTLWQRDLDKLPPSARMLGCDGPEFALYERDGEPLCLIGARGYRNQAWPIGEPIAAGITRNAAVQELRATCPQAQGAPFAVGVLHTGFNPDQSKAYSDPQVLAGVDVDYWACGHLHEKSSYPSESNPRIVFPGCIQGRDLKESGEKGCYLVSITESAEGGRPHVSLDFVPTASVSFRSISLDVSACKTLSDIEHLAQARMFRESAEASCDEMVTQVALTGVTDLHEYLMKQNVIADLRKRLNEAYPTFCCDVLENRTTPPRDREKIIDENLFPAHVLRVAEEQADGSGAAIGYLQAEFVRLGIGLPDLVESDVENMNSAAEALVLDLIEGECL